MPKPSLARSCPRCGAALKTATLHGLHVIVCGRCDLVLATRAELDALVNGPLGDLPTEEAATEEVRPKVYSAARRPSRDLWEELATDAPAPPRRIGAVVATTAAVSVLLGVLLPIAFFAGREMSGGVVEPAVIPSVAATPAVEQPTTGAVAVAAATAPEPEPQPVAVPEPAPVAKALSPAKIVARAWAEVDRGDAAGAEASFREALRARPGDAEATYGIGYAMVRQGRVQDGRAWLCDALKLGPTVDTQREIVGLLESKQLTCQ